MRSGGGHAKGASFERHVCKTFSLWLSDGKRDDLLWRTAMSGGRATLQRRKGKDALAQAGDIGAISARGEALTKRFVIECKHVKSMDLISFAVHRRGSGYRFWDKLCGECRGKQEPLLIARQNLLPTMMFTTGRGAETLGYYAWSAGLDIADDVYPVRIGYLSCAYVHVFRFDDFMERVECPL